MNGRRACILSVTALLLLPLLSHALELGPAHDCNPLPGFSGLAITGAPRPWAGQCFIDGNAGLTLQALGHRAAEDWLRLRVPWWNPYAGLGMPLAAEMQPAALFLPFILLMHFSDGLLLLKIATQVTAGLCMLFCLRSLGLGRRAALFGALLYELDGTFAWFGDAPMLPLPFLPLLIGGIERATTSAQRARTGGIPAVAAGIGFSLLAGFPETAFLNGVLAAIWAAVRLGGSDRTARRRLVGKLAAGGVAGLALAAPAVVSFLDYLASGALTFRGSVAENQLLAGQDAALLLPTLFGPPYFAAATAWGGAGGYLGAALVLPGLVALLGNRDRRAVRVLATVWTVFWLAVFLGEPVSRHIWQSLPLLNQAVVTRYAMPSMAFLWTVLAALGWDRIRHRARRAWVAAPLFLALALAVLLHAFFIGRLGFQAGWPALLPPALTVGWTLAVAGVFAGLVWRPADLMKRLTTDGAALALGALLLSDALASFMVPQLAGAAARTLDMAPVAFLRAQPGFPRSYALDGLLEPNYGSYFGIATLQAFSLPAPALWGAYAPKLDPRIMGEMFAPSSLSSQAARLQAARTAFEDAGVGFVLVPPGTDPIAPLHDPHFDLAFQSPAARIYRLPGAKPYFAITAGGPCAVTAATRTRVRAKCVAPATLLRREMYQPEWHATLNERKTQVSQADGVFQSVRLAAGDSRIAFRYVPAHARLMAASLVAVCLAGCAYGLRSWRARRPGLMGA